MFLRCFEEFLSPHFSSSGRAQYSRATSHLDFKKSEFNIL